MSFLFLQTARYTSVPFKHVPGLIYLHSFRCSNFSSTDVLPKWFVLYDDETGVPFYLETDSLLVRWDLPEKIYGTPLPFSSSDDAKLRKYLGPPPPSSADNTPAHTAEDDIISFNQGPDVGHDSDDEASPLRLPKAAPRPKPNLIKTDEWFRSITGSTEEELGQLSVPFVLDPDTCSLSMRQKRSMLTS